MQLGRQRELFWLTVKVVKERVVCWLLENQLSPKRRCQSFSERSFADAERALYGNVTQLIFHFRFLFYNARVSHKMCRFSSLHGCNQSAEQFQ